MTNPTLERAARALIERAGYTEYGPIVQPSLAPELARAVLMAVRDDPPLMKVEFYPSDEMYDVGRISRDGWEDMIDAILKESE